jgi:hypothetical protein
VRTTGFVERDQEAVRVLRQFAGDRCHGCLLILTSAQVEPTGEDWPDEHRAAFVAAAQRRRR